MGFDRSSLERTLSRVPECALIAATPRPLAAPNLTAEDCAPRRQRAAPSEHYESILGLRGEPIAGSLFLPKRVVVCGAAGHRPGRLNSDLVLGELRGAQLRQRGSWVTPTGTAFPSRMTCC